MSVRHLKASVALTAIVSFLVVVPAAPGAGHDATISRDVVHRSEFWSWTGPQNWSASYGAYGITVSSPTGTSAIDYGFSSVLCTPGNSVRQSVDRHFAALRRGINQSPNSQVTGVGRVRRLTSLGANYFRQRVTVRGRVSGTRVRGEAVFDYQVPDPTYCYQSNRFMVAPARNFRQRFRALNRIFHSFAYFGPGAEDPDQ